MKKKILKISAAMVALVGAGALLLASVSAPLQVETQVLEPVTAAVTFTAQGAGVYNEMREVTAPMAGEVRELLVVEGQRVQQGDAIAVLSADDVAYQIQRLQADIRGYWAQIQNLQLGEQQDRDILAGNREDLEGQLTTLRSQMKGHENAESTREAQIRLQESVVGQDRDNARLAQRDLRNYRDDHGGDTTDPEYTALRAALNTAEKNLYLSEQTLLELQNSSVEEGYYEGLQQSLEAQIDNIDARLESTYSTGMQAYYTALIDSAALSIAELGEKQGRATVTAPCDGVVSALQLRELQLVEPGDAVATIGGDPLVEVLVPVREMDGIALGDTVQLTLSRRAGDELSTGTVTEIESEARIQISPLGVEESKLRVLIAPDTPTAVGYQVDVEFTVYRQENCLVAPAKAVFQQGGADCVWVIREGEAFVQPVTKGVETRGGVVIREGLSSGDVIISDANIQKLADGKRVAQAV